MWAKAEQSGDKLSQNNVLWAQKANSGIGGVLSKVADLTDGRRMGQSPKKWLGRCEVRGTKRKEKTYITCAARLIVGGDCQSCSRRFSFFL